VNEEAARITAFSLYLALLHYLDPPAITEQIKQGNKLPNLLVSEHKSKNHFQCIWVGNAFDATAIESNPLLASRFGKHCADIIVSNPPWGASGNKADAETKARQKVMLEWCRVNKKTIGDKEPSQAFLWRSLDFLKDGGKAAVLVSAGVLFKHSTTTRAFREQWMDRVRLIEVFNFTHVRKFFFKGADSPFVIICFVKDRQDDFPVKYWSAKQVIALKETEAVLFEAERLQSFESLLKLESRYEPPVFTSPPERVHRFGAKGAYRGLRVIVNEGMSENSQPQGIIIAQFSDIPFCYYRSVYGLKLSEQEEWCHKVLLGILWSSFARYYFFMTSANWGLWHHKLLLDELLRLPAVLDRENPISRKIIAIVDSLRNYHPQRQDLLHPDGVPETEIKAQRRILEKELDEAVFELYGLNEEQKDLIRDCCEVTLPFFYKPFNSVGTMPAVRGNDLSWIEKYARIFARRWNTYLGDVAEMRAEVHVGAHGNMVAVEFFPADRTDPWNLNPKNDSWQYVLEKIGKALPQPMETSQILVDGVVHVISDDAVIVIKRNERRFWTRSLAREDADVTLCKRMVESKLEDGGQD